MNYNKKTVRDIDVAGKKVLLRCDFNVPMAKDGSGVITDDKRIRAALPTIQYLLDQNAAVIACSHLGKPVATFDSYVKKQAEKGKDPASITEEEWKKSLAKLSLAPVAKRLSELLGKEVIMASDVVGPDAMAKAAEVEIISAHKVDGLRVCVICKGDVAACQAAVETGALLAQSLNGLNGYNIIPSPAEEPDSLMDMLEDIKRKKAARKAAKLARMAAAKGEAAAPAAEESPKGKAKK